MDIFWNEGAKKEKHAFDGLNTIGMSACYSPNPSSDLGFDIPFDLKTGELDDAVGYAFAWFSHFAIEKNRPATFKYPLWSFISDYKMMFYMLAGKMDAELDRVVSK